MSLSVCFYFILLLAVSIDCVSGVSRAVAPSTLVVVKDDFSKYTYSRLFKSLKRRGHAISIKSSVDKSIKLTEYGESLYSNLIILSPSSKQIGDLSYKDILNFIDAGNNVLIGLDHTYSSEFIKKIADRCGIDLLSKNTKVYDHLSYDTLRKHSSLNALAHDTILLSNWPKYRALIPSDAQEPSAPILYNGIGMKLKKNSHLSLSLLSGNSGTYATDSDANGPIDKAILSSGSALSLIAALQMRNNARITFIGSLKMLSDEYFVSPVQSSWDGKRYEKSGNEELMALVSAWAFGEVGVLRITNSTHHLQVHAHNNEKEVTINPTRYRIKDFVTYSATIEEYALECDCWRPFLADDVQFDFVRLDSFIRQNMKHDDKGKYTIDFMLPDVFGIYKFTIKYQRKGWGYIEHEQLVSVRPFRHDEYQRFLPTAFPYYLGSASMIIGFALFTIVFLFGAFQKSAMAHLNVRYDGTPELLHRPATKQGRTASQKDINNQRNW
eukprot:730675_1